MQLCTRLSVLEINLIVLYYDRLMPLWLSYGNVCSRFDIEDEGPWKRRRSMSPVAFPPAFDRPPPQVFNQSPQPSHNTSVAFLIAISTRLLNVEIFFCTAVQVDHPFNGNRNEPTQSAIQNAMGCR